jgi:hypothetical protein
MMLWINAIAMYVRCSCAQTLWKRPRAENDVFEGCSGDWPKSVKSRVAALPAFTPQQSADIINSTNYYAMNYYTAKWALPFWLPQHVLF